MKRGITIAFVGTDGSGKSTVIEHITPWLESINTNGVHYEHLRPNLLPPLGAATGKSYNKDSGPVLDPHGQKPSGVLGSLVRVMYYSIDYCVGYWRKIIPLCRKDGQICLFDRYFYDIEVDPRRMRIALPTGILRGVFKLLPKPDLVLCLGADPNVIYERKPETSLEEVTRQVTYLKTLCKKNKRAVWVDTGESIEASIAAVKSAVLNLQ